MRDDAPGEVTCYPRAPLARQLHRDLDIANPHQALNITVLARAPLHRAKGERRRRRSHGYEIAESRLNIQKGLLDFLSQTRPERIVAKLQWVVFDVSRRHP
jgi:hypothetical protein